MYFYLKINQDKKFALSNFDIWLQCISEFEKAKVAIVCDDYDVVDKLQSIIDKTDIPYEVINSFDLVDERMNLILELCKGRFLGAGRAHLTTFFHACSNGIKEFWNIDADDTRMLLPPSRIASCLKIAETYAKKNGIDLFSLDMLENRKREIPGWTFGITYTNNNIDWINLMLKHLNDDKRVKVWDLTDCYARNIDTYFMYLQYFGEANIQTFYFENLVFVHYYDDMLDRLHGAGIFWWKEGYLTYPLIELFV